MSKRQILLTLFAALFVASVGGTVMSGGDSEADYTIRFSFLGSPEDEDYDGALVFKQYVESRSNSRAEVEISPSGQFCSNERECLEGMQTGVLEVFMLTTGSLASIFGPGQVLDLPYTFRDDAVAECVIRRASARQARIRLRRRREMCKEGRALAPARKCWRGYRSSA